MDSKNTISADRPANTHGLIRRNICITPETAERGEKLSTLEKRSFSNLVNVLIDREYERMMAADSKS